MDASAGPGAQPVVMIFFSRLAQLRPHCRRATHMNSFASDLQLLSSATAPTTQHSHTPSLSRLHLRLAAPRFLVPRRPARAVETCSQPARECPLRETRIKHRLSALLALRSSSRGLARQNSKARELRAAFLEQQSRFLQQHPFGRRLSKGGAHVGAAPPPTPARLALYAHAHSSFLNTKAGKRAATK